MTDNSRGTKSFMTPERFIDKWQDASGSERANYQSFFNDLCELLGVAKPDPAQTDKRDNAYAAHLAEGMAIGQGIAPFLPEGVTLEIVMPTAESIAAKSTMVDLHVWNAQSQAWEKTADWRDRLSPDWFDPEPAGKLRHLHP